VVGLTGPLPALIGDRLSGIHPACCRLGEKPPKVFSTAVSIHLLEKQFLVV
jgi:hypothetical protein